MEVYVDYYNNLDEITTKYKKDKYSQLLEGKEIGKLMINKGSPWKVIIADNNEDIHFNTNMMFMKYYSHDGKDIQFLSCYSYSQIFHQLQEHPDTAVILLDARLENDNKWFNFVKKVRKELKNDMIRINIHGLSKEEISERDTFIKYDISNNKGIEELNPTDIFISIVSSLERFRDKKIKEVLFKEVHHRVKNNLQIIQSILSLQSQYFKNPEFSKELKEGINRIQTIANIHKNLYEEENIARVNFSKYVRDLVFSIFRNYKEDYKDINHELRIKNNMTLDIDMAIPCGLIINEIVSNSLKHAFKKTDTGKITLTFIEFEEGFFKLVITDNGCGIPFMVDFQDTETLGFELVSLLVSQLGGTIKLDTSENNGTTITIYFTEMS